MVPRLHACILKRGSNTTLFDTFLAIRFEWTQMLRQQCCRGMCWISLWFALMWAITNQRSGNVFDSWPGVTISQCCFSAIRHKATCDIDRSDQSSHHTHVYEVTTGHGDMFLSVCSHLSVGSGSTCGWSSSAAAPLSVGPKESAGLRRRAIDWYHQLSMTKQRPVAWIVTPGPVRFPVELNDTWHS